MDLFNPPINFDYKTMSDKIKLDEYQNPYLQVVWEDTAENFTQERIKSVKQYFSKKYNTSNVNVITKTKQGEDGIQTIDVSFNIMETFPDNTFVHITVGCTCFLRCINLPS